MNNGTLLNRSVERALVLLSALGRGKATLTVLAEDADLPVPTVLRLLRTMQEHGFVRRVDSGEFSLGPAIMRLGFLVDSEGPMRWMVQKAVTDLRDAVDETATFWVRDGSQRRCVAIAESSKSVRWLGSVGMCSAINQGAAGKVLLAFGEDNEHGSGAARGRPKARKGQPVAAGFDAEFAAILKTTFEQGYAVSEREVTKDAFGVAAPLFIGDTLLGSLGIAVPISRLLPESRDELIRICCEVAENAAEISWSRPSQDSASPPSRTRAVRRA